MKLTEVARWEFRKQVTSKAFLISTAIIPLILGLVGFIPVLVGKIATEAKREIAVLDLTGEIYPELAAGPSDLRMRFIEVQGQKEALIRKLKEGEWDGLLVIETDVFESNAVSFYVRNIGGLGTERLAESLSRILVEKRLYRAGHDPEEIMPLVEGVHLATVTLQLERGPGNLALSLGIAFLLLAGTFFSGTSLLGNVVKEKSGRVVELMLSSVSARDLLMGKILGLGAVGIIQITVWGAVAYILAQRYLPVPMSIKFLTPLQLAGYPLYFALGYLLIAALYASMGAGAKDVQSGSQLQGLVLMLPMVPLWLSGTLVSSPELPIFRILSFVPVFTPGMMLIRLGASTVPWWEVAATLSSLAISVYLAMIFSTRVFQVAMLMYGKPATLREIWRWGTKGLGS